MDAYEHSNILSVYVFISGKLMMDGLKPWAQGLETLSAYGLE